MSGEPGLALECVQCKTAWATMSWDEYLDKAPHWDLISGTGLYPESFCPACRAVVLETPEALEEPYDHRLLQDDGGVRCECGKVYSPFRTNLLKGVRVDWGEINRQRLKHHAEVLAAAS